jgi:hypothetical protein
MEARDERRLLRLQNQMVSHKLLIIAPSARPEPANFYASGIGVDRKQPSCKRSCLQILR